MLDNDFNIECENGICLEPRLQEYIKKKKHYKKNNIHVDLPLEKQYNITGGDVKLIKAFLKGDKSVYNYDQKEEYIDSFECDTGFAMDPDERYRADPRFKRYLKKVEKDKNAMKQRYNFGGIDQDYNNAFQSISPVAAENDKNMMNIHMNNNNEQLYSMRHRMGMDENMSTRGGATMQGREIDSGSDMNRRSGATMQGLETGSGSDMNRRSMGEHPPTRQGHGMEISGAYDNKGYEVDTKNGFVDSRYGFLNDVNKAQRPTTDVTGRGNLFFKGCNSYGEKNKRKHNKYGCDKTKEIYNAKNMEFENVVPDIDYNTRLYPMDNNVPRPLPVGHDPRIYQMMGELNSYEKKLDQTYRIDSEMDTENRLGRQLKQKPTPYIGMGKDILHIEDKDRMCGYPGGPNATNSKAKSHGYSNPVEHYFDYISCDIQDPDHVVFQRPLPTRLNNYTQAKTYRRDIIN